MTNTHFKNKLLICLEKTKNKTECRLLVEPRAAHKMVEPSNIFDSCIPFVNLGSEMGGELLKRHHNITAVASHEPPSAKTVQVYGSRWIVRAKVVNKGQHGDRRLAMAGGGGGRRRRRFH